MEIRIWIPEVWSGWRYCFRHPRSFIIGTYGFKRWFNTHQDLLRRSGELHREQIAHSVTQTKLADAEQELARLKLVPLEATYQRLKQQRATNN